MIRENCLERSHEVSATNRKNLRTPPDSIHSYITLRVCPSRLCTCLFTNCQGYFNSI